MIFEALQFEKASSKFHSLSSKILKFPEFNLSMNFRVEALFSNLGIIFTHEAFSYLALGIFDTIFSIELECIFFCDNLEAFLNILIKNF